MILFDGPRAVPCRGPEGKLSVLLLTVPLQPGRYAWRLSQSWNLRFWASDRGLLAMHWRFPSLPTTFSLIFAISVIEHIARDNSVYGAIGQHDPAGRHSRCCALPGVGRVASSGASSVDSRHGSDYVYRLGLRSLAAVFASGEGGSSSNAKSDLGR